MAQEIGYGDRECWPVQENLTQEFLDEEGGFGGNITADDFCLENEQLYVCCVTVTWGFGYGCKI